MRYLINVLVLLISANSLFGLFIPSSPLDNGEENAMFNTSSFEQEYADRSSPCESACLMQTLKTIQYFIEPGNIQINMETVCRHYEEAVDCHEINNHCDQSLFEAVTSGVRYMCVEQRHAFSHLIGCIDENTETVKKGCDNLCHPNNLLAGLAVKDTFMDTLDKPLINQGVNMRGMIEPHLGKFFFSETCRMADCLMNCYRTKFNMLCEGSAGSILMEMLIRPVAQENTSDGSKLLAEVVGGLIPNTCSHLYDSNSQLRISPELNNEIKRMYQPKVLPDPSKDIARPAVDVNPFQEVPEDLLINSPFESQPSLPPVVASSRSDSSSSTGGVDFIAKSDSEAVLSSSGDKDGADKMKYTKMHLRKSTSSSINVVPKEYTVIVDTDEDSGLVVCDFEIEEEGSGF